MPTFNYQEIDSFLVDFSKRISIIKATTPTNLKEQQQLFYKHNFKYNPQFAYKPLKANLSTYQTHIHNILPTIPTDPIGQLYTDRLNECLTVLDIINSIGKNTKHFTQNSIKLYGTPTNKYLQIAEKYSQKTKPSKPKTQDQSKMLTAQEVAEQFQQKIAELHLDNSVVILSDPTGTRKNRISIGKISGKITISPDCVRTQSNLNGVIAHELLTHAIRSRNGKQQTHGIFYTGTAGYTATEEGLASLMTYIYTAIDDFSPSASSPITLQLIKLGLTSDFQTTFAQAYKYYPNDKDKAWNYTVRVKRGISNTSQVGGFTKDQYFQWSLQVAQQIIDKPSLLDYAFNGKASLDQLATFTSPQKNSIIDLTKIQKTINFFK